MRQMKGCLGVLALSVGVAFAVPAAATEWLSSAATGTTAGMTITVGGQTVKVRAYSTQTLSSTPTSVAPTTGVFTTANLFTYSGGFGITNTVSTDTYEGTQPEHAVDNNQVFDMLVFELPTSGFDLEAFRLGWATEAYAPDQTVTGEADIQAYFGGNNLGANYNFATACITASTGCANALTDTTKFTNLNSLITVGAGGGDNVPINTDVTIAGTQSGRYLVMTGALNGTNDAFKIDSIKASAGGIQGLPTPGTLALLGLGLLGLVTLRWRPAFA